MLYAGALNYLHKFWKEVFTYIKDGRYPISNNLAERAVRPFTTQRKNSLHFGSDEGAEIAAVYHSIISTVKLQGRSTWDYLGKLNHEILKPSLDTDLESKVKELENKKNENN